MPPKRNSSGKEKSTASSTHTSSKRKDPKTTSQNASKDNEELANVASGHVKKRKQSTSHNLNVNDADAFPIKEQVSSAATSNEDDLLSAKNLALFKSIQQQLEKNKKEGQQADDTGM